MPGRRIRYHSIFEASPGRIQATESQRAAVPPGHRIAHHRADLHQLAAQLQEHLEAMEANEKGLKVVEVPNLPRVSVSKQNQWRCCQCFHVLIVLLSEHGVDAREVDGHWPCIVFAKEKEHVRVEIEEVVEQRLKPRKPSTERYPQYVPPEYTYHPTGFLQFHMVGSRGGMTGQKNWTESPKQPVDWILPRIVQRILKNLPQLIAEGIEAERRHQEYLEERRRREHPKRIVSTNTAFSKT